MGLTTLHGTGAITISDDRTEYRASNGRIAVPDHLVQRAIAAGFSRHPRPVVALADVAVDPFPPIDATLSDATLLSLFASEAIERGYRAAAAASIAQGRLRHLRAGGDGYDLLSEPAAPVVAEEDAAVSVVVTAPEGSVVLPAISTAAVHPASAKPTGGRNGNPGGRR